MYPVCEWSELGSGHHKYQRAGILITGQTLIAIGSQVCSTSTGAWRMATQTRSFSLHLGEVSLKRKFELAQPITSSRFTF
jgi:hypothetical protein